MNDLNAKINCKITEQKDYVHLLRKKRKIDRYNESGRLYYKKYNEKNEKYLKCM